MPRLNMRKQLRDRRLRIERQRYKRDKPKRVEQQKAAAVLKRLKLKQERKEKNDRIYDYIQYVLRKGHRVETDDIESQYANMKEAERIEKIHMFFKLSLIETGYDVTEEAVKKHLELEKRLDSFTLISAYRLRVMDHYRNPIDDYFIETSENCL